MGFRSFDPTHGYDKSAMEEIVARVQDIKASPIAGKQRLVVREKGMNLSHAIIDIDMKHAKELKAKETYSFQVQEKDDSKNPGFQRQKSASFRAYDCEDKPEAFSAAAETKKRMNRFKGGGRV